MREYSTLHLGIQESKGTALLLTDFFSNKNETMFGSGYENCPEFGILGGVIFKLDIL
jgi:hypothetical protein